jgi:hypothetical protein
MSDTSDKVITGSGEHYLKMNVGALSDPYEAAQILVLSNHFP